MTITLKHFFSIGLVGMFFLANGVAAESQKTAAMGDKPADGVATLVVKIGQVSIQKIGAKEWTAARKGMLLFNGDTIQTREMARAALLLQDGSLIKLNENSNLILQLKSREQKANRLKLLFGQLWAKVNKQKTDLEIETPSAVAAIKGTELELLVMQNGNAELIVWDGLVGFSNELGNRLVGAAFHSRASRGQIPGEPEKVELDKKDQWFQSVVEIPAGKLLKTTVKDKDGKDYQLKLQYKKK